MMIQRVPRRNHDLPLTHILRSLSFPQQQGTTITHENGVTCAVELGLVVSLAML